MMTRRELLARWSTPEGRRLAEDAAFRLVSGDTFAGTQHVLHAGRVDLRGLRLPMPDQLARVTVGSLVAQIVNGTISLRGATWQDLDLSFADLGELRFFDSAIANCVFEGASCSGWRLWNSRVSDSTFTRADLRDAGLGTWQGGLFNTWENVVFDKADLRGSFARTARFLGCDFRGTRLGRIRFLNCVLHDLRFEGPLEGVFFGGGPDHGDPDPGPLRNVDFSKATFNDVEFWDYLFENVVLPNDPDIILVPQYRRVARRELELLHGDQSFEARGLRKIIEADLVMRSREEAPCVFNRRDMYAVGNEKFSHLIESTLLQAMKDVEALA